MRWGKGLKPFEVIPKMQIQRIAVVDNKGNPLMPTTPQRARRWVESGKAVGRWSDLNVWYVQLTAEPSGKETQPISIGIDPGKLYSGIAAQSARFTLFLAHLVLPFKRVKERKEFQALMRRGRRGRRINRKVAFHLRAHRQKRFNNRRQKKVAPSIRANRQLELRVVKELCSILPISSIVYEYVKADVDLTSGRKKARSGKGFSAVMVGQKWMLSELSKLGPEVKTLLGWQTAQVRNHLGLEKSHNKKEQSPASHAVDGVALASSEFVGYRKYHYHGIDGADWFGAVQTSLTGLFLIIKRPPISRRQLHLAQPAKGGVRRKYGGTINRHNGLRKGDLVKAVKAGKEFFGWVSGDTKTQVSLSDANWKRIGYFSASKVKLIQRSTRLLATRAAKAARVAFQPRTKVAGLPCYRITFHALATAASPCNTQRVHLSNLWRTAMTKQEIVDRKEAEILPTLKGWADEFGPEYLLSLLCEEFGYEFEGVRNSSEVMEF